MYKECIENGCISCFPDEEKCRGCNKSLVYFNSNHCISSVHRNINYFRSNLQKMKYREGSSSHVYHSIRESSYNQNKTLEANQNNENSKLSFSGSHSQEEYKFYESKSSSFRVESEEETVDFNPLKELFIKDTVDTSKNFEHEVEGLDNDVEHIQNSFIKKNSNKQRKRQLKLNDKKIEHNKMKQKENFYIDLEVNEESEEN